MPAPNFEHSPETTVRELATSLMDSAEFFIVSGGTYVSNLWTHDSSGWKFEMIELVDRAAKYAFFHELGERVKGSNIDGVVFGSEVWISFDKKLLEMPYPDVEGDPHRLEAVAVSGVSKDGNHIEIARPFTRDRKGKPVLVGDRNSFESGSLKESFWRPVLAAWNLV